MDAKERLEEIKNSLSLEQVEELLQDLGGEPQRHGNIIISKTICHCGETHKLYYYDNTKLFRCFTECYEAFDIFALIMKVRECAGAGIALPQALNYVINFFNLTQFAQDFPTNNNELQDWQILKKYNKNTSQEYNKQIIELKFYDKNILKFLPFPRILPWERENIDRDVMLQYRYPL